MRVFSLSAFLSVLCFPCFVFSDDRPHNIRALQPGITLSLVAEQPDIVTPTGIDVDDRGRVWTIACHTHFPPKDYPGPKKDQILVFDRDGKRSVFYNKTFHTMDLELGPDAWVYLAERGRIFRIKDTNNDGIGDVEENLAVLETEGDYPHNGLSGLAFHPKTGDLYFGMGENFARHWTLTGKDGTQVEGYGEGGIFHCRPDGTKLHRMARGLWNPFGMLVRGDGEIFVSDNDPGERPPCRLLNIVEGGDYGFQRLYGGEAHHPFVCWNGELRGTLPMIHPSGEAPCGVVQLGRGVIIPSWGDHRIDFYLLKQKGAGYTADRIQIVGGSPYFRPTGIAASPVGNDAKNTMTWYFNDWVDASYPVHGYGRLWKMEIDLEKAAKWTGQLDLIGPNDDKKLAARLRGGKTDLSVSELLTLTRSKDQFLGQAAFLALAEKQDWTAESFQKLSDADRVQAVIALKLSGVSDKKWIPLLLEDQNPEVVFETLRWISDRQLKACLPRVDAISRKKGISFKLFEAAVAARNMLIGKPELGVRDRDLLLSRVLDESNSPRLRAYALRLLPTGNNRIPKKMNDDFFRRLFSVGDEQLSLETTRFLAGHQLLVEVAGDKGNSARIRATAIAGFGPLVDQNVPLLIELSASPVGPVREEALRGLRTAALTDTQKRKIQALAGKFPQSATLVAAILDPAKAFEGRPALTDTAAWLVRLDAVKAPVDTHAGERIFHNTRLGLCGNCHRYNGRGNVVGPDLSRVGDQGDRAWLLTSILNPNAEVAPQYLPRILKLKDGSSFVGIRLRSSRTEVLRDIEGKSRSFNIDTIDSIQELQSSFMPVGLPMALTDHELRDLVAFLEATGLDD